MADRPCPATVDECTVCEWRGGNHVGQPCSQCSGEVQRRPCRQQAIRGGSVCEAHGGSAPQVRAAANRRLAEDKARRSLDEIEVTPIEHPLEAFGQLVAEAVALKDALASQVAALENMRAEPSKWGRAEQVRAEVSLYERALDRAGKLLEQWVRLGLEERLVVQRERLIALHGSAATAVVLLAFEQAADLTPAQMARARLLLYDLAGQFEGIDEAEVDRRLSDAMGRFDALPRVPAAELPPGFLEANPDAAYLVEQPNRTAALAAKSKETDA